MIRSLLQQSARRLPGTAGPGSKSAPWPHVQHPASPPSCIVGSFCLLWQHWGLVGGGGARRAHCLVWDCRILWARGHYLLPGTQGPHTAPSRHMAAPLGAVLRAWVQEDPYSPSCGWWSGSCSAGGAVDWPRSGGRGRQTRGRGSCRHICADSCHSRQARRSDWLCLAAGRECRSLPNLGFKACWWFWCPVQLLPLCTEPSRTPRGLYPGACSSDGARSR